MKPYAESCDQNRDPILKVISRLFADSVQRCWKLAAEPDSMQSFSRKMPIFSGRPAIKLNNMPVSGCGLQESGLPNVAAPLLLDISEPVACCRCRRGILCQHRPHHALARGGGDDAWGAGAWRRIRTVWTFQLSGCYTSESNARFDQWLKSRDPQSGIRDIGI